jgi:hypothetical protein
MTESSYQSPMRERSSTTTGRTSIIPYPSVYPGAPCPSHACGKTWGGLAQVGVEVAARFLVAVNVPVERLVADIGHVWIAPDVIADLLGAPLLGRSFSSAKRRVPESTGEPPLGPSDSACRWLWRRSRWNGSYRSS